jgi:hypothetical protein
MFEIIGLLFATVAGTVLSIAFGVLLGLLAWLLMLGRKKRARLVLMTAALPPLSWAYVIAMAILFTIFVPHQPDEFFGDFDEPLPHGYSLKGLGKMPDYAYFDSEVKGKRQPEMRGEIGRIREEGDLVYGQYSHPFPGPLAENSQGNLGYFVFSTSSGTVQNFETRKQLEACAGHSLEMVEPQFFRSQLPGRIRLRRVETATYGVPPLLALSCCLVAVVTWRLSSKSSLDTA